MPPVRIELVILGARDVADHLATCDDVAPLLQAVLDDVPHQVEHMRAHLDVDDPSLRAALDAYVDGLRGLHAALRAGDPAAVAGAGAGLENALSALRGAQAALQERMSSGPTAFLYLNRMLRMMDATPPDPRLEALLAQAPDFVLTLRRELRGAPTQLAYRTVLELEQHLGALPAEAARRGLVEVAEKVTGLLAQYAEPPESGPTGVPPIDQLLRAVEQVRAGDLTPDAFREIAADCRDQLRASLGPSTPTEALRATCGVVLAVDALEDEPEADLDPLIEAAHDLAAVLSTPTPGALPPVLADALALAEACIRGARTPEAVYEAADQLDAVVDGLEARLAEDGVSDEGAAIAPGLQSLRDLAAALRSVADSGDARALAAAQALAEEAAALLA